jgi:RNA polymerase sigma-70 factor (ECF subfamily)
MSQPAAFDALYRAHYADVVAMTYALTGDLTEAQDVVQEAFCRAWQRWTDVARYDNPLAWVRRVAVNLVNSRWRHLRVVRHHTRHERAGEVPALAPDRVALVAALRTLPRDQRTAMVLHYVVDLPLAEVAAQLGVPAGTVKSWLHRGRAALAAHLSDEIEAVTGNG